MDTDRVSSTVGSWLPMTVPAVSFITLAYEQMFLCVIVWVSTSHSFGSSVMRSTAV